MAASSFVKFFPSDWRSGCLVLTLEEEGLYIRSCNFMWDTGEPLPADDKTAARLLGVQILKYVKVMGSLIEKGKLARTQAGILNDRVMRTLDEMKLQQAERSQRASQGHQTKQSSWDKIRELTAAVTTLKAQLDARQEGHTGGVTPRPTPHLTTPVSPGVTPTVPPGVTPTVPPGVDTKISEQNQQNSLALDETDAGKSSRLPDTRDQIEKKGKGEQASGEANSPSRLGRAQALEAFNAYNALALRCGLSQAKVMTPGREKGILARLREYGLDGWQVALANVERSNFLRGGNDRHWRADLDFLLQASSFSKTHDGGFGNGAHGDDPKGGPARATSAADRELAGIIGGTL